MMLTLSLKGCAHFVDISLAMGSWLHKCITILVLCTFISVLSAASVRRIVGEAISIHSRAKCMLLLGGLSCGLNMAPVHASAESTISAPYSTVLSVTPLLATTDGGSRTVLPLEVAVQQLERCATRDCNVQGLADLYESAGAETSLARNEYKYRIVEAVNQQRASLGKGWDSTLRYEAGEVKRRADPFRTVDLAAYLSIAPYVGGACYLAALLVQKLRPEKFVFAYPGAVAVFLFPIVYTVLTSFIRMSTRLIKTESPYIEDVLDKYASLPDLTMLALGSVYWGPPKESLNLLAPLLSEPSTQKYGSILGNPELRSHITSLLQDRGLSMDGMDVAITAGANQAFMNAAMAVCDQDDTAILLAPYYFSHKLSLQLCGAQVSVCPFNPATLASDFVALERMMAEQKPRMVVLTTPNNPSGYVYTRPEIQRLIDLCRAQDAWLVADQTYHEFLYDDAQHVFPCGGKAAFSYDKIMHIFSFSKIFGMPGWRVGYIVYPASLTPHMRKIQDTVPTHAAILSQQLALNCLREHYPLPAQGSTGTTRVTGMEQSARARYSPWAASTVGTLEGVRAALWPAVQPLGTVYTEGAFYFLVPVPAQVGEEEAVDILATQFGVLLMPGSAFGAPQHMRLSYGSIPPAQVLAAVDKFQRGLAHLQRLSAQRQLECTSSSL